MMGEAVSENGTNDENLLKDCFDSAKTYLRQVEALGEASSSLSHHWGALLAQTPCGPAAKHFQNACKDLQVALAHGSGQMLGDLTKAQERVGQNGKKLPITDRENGPASQNCTEKDDTSQPAQNDKKEWSEEFKVIASCFASLVSFHYQMFLRASESFTQFSKLDASDSSDGPASSEQDSLKGGKKSDLQGGATADSADVDKTAEGSMSKDADGAAHKMVVGSPSGLRKLSSFLSKLGRSGSSPSPSDLSQSVFYFDVPDQGGAGEHLASADKKNGVKPKIMDHTAGSVHANQHVIGSNSTKDSISQEELDSVIDFLSGFKVPMQTIHEHIPTQLNSNSRAVGSQLNQHKDSDVQQLQAERQSSKPYAHKTNTWPYRLSSKGAAEMASPYSAFGLGEAALADPEYWRYLNSVGHLKQGDALGGRSAWNTASAMTAGDAGLNRSWPHQAMGQETFEGSGRGWSCATGDSSSCSDESSNGEAPWMMGFDLMNSVNSKRRHSSGEDGLMPTNHVAAANIRQNPTDGRPRSVEDLLEAKSHKTWPPKQPWMKGHPQEGVKDDTTTEGAMSQPVVQPQPYHPPLTMQWSDPLTNRPLSTWGTGLNPTLSNQGMANYGSGLL